MAWAILFGGAAVALVAAFFGQDAQALVLVISCLVGPIWSATRIRHFRPAHPSVWIGYTGTCILFFVSFALGAVNPALQSGSRPTLGIGDLLNAAALLLSVITTWRVGTLRGFRKDMASMIDGLVVAGEVAIVMWAGVMVPYVLNHDIAAGTRAITVLFTSIDLLFVFFSSWALLGPGRRVPSFYMMLITTVCALPTEIITDLINAHMAFAGASQLVGFLGTMVFISIPAAATHPSMVDLTTPTRVGSGHTSVVRFIFMTVAVLTPPAASLFHLGDHDSLAFQIWLIPAWLVMTVLVMTRFGMLTRNHERAARHDRILNGAASALVALTEREDMHALAGRAMLDLAGGHDSSHRASVLECVGGTWREAYAAGDVSAWAPSPEKAAWVAMHLAEDENSVQMPVAGSSPLSKGDERPFVVAPLRAQGDLRGALLLTTRRPESTAVVDSLGMLAADLALALESALLVQEVHRRRSHEQFRALVEHSDDLIIVVNDYNIPGFLSPAAERLIGVPKSAPDFMTRIFEEDREVFAEAIEQVRSGIGGQRFECRLLDSAGNAAWFEITVTDARQVNEVAGIVLNGRDVTERKRAEQGQQRERARFASMVEHSSDVVALLDSEGRIEYVSASSEHVLGLPPEPLVGMRLSDLVHPEDRLDLERITVRPQAQAQSGPQRCEIRVLGHDDTWCTLEMTTTDRRSDPAVAGIVVNAHDVTNRKSLEDDLRHRVLHDDLTGIANRVLFGERVGDALRRPAAAGSGTAVLFIDLDDFKTVNDSLGHAAGDALLQVIADRLRGALRDSDLAARLGGDEFAVLLEGFDSPDHVVEVAERLLEMIQQPFQFHDRSITVSASIGVAIGSDGADSSDLLRSADAAMYYAKWDGKGRLRVFDEGMHATALERLELKADLARAMERGELSIAYQPLMTLENDVISGFEALLRWNHPTRGFVSPATFIPLAEETQLIVPIGEWILKESLDQLARWQQHPARASLTMNVNISPYQLRDDAAVSSIEMILHASAVPAATVTLELTESTVINDERSRERLVRIRDLGVGIAADDFGSGFASYAALHQLPFSMVKIDGEFLTALGQPNGAEAHLRAIVEMAHATGLIAVAEGIETHDQLARVKELGCDIGQGYLIGRPLGANEASALIGANVSATSAS